ncbi:MAG TPA: cation diffusion facilitator family transporter [Methylomirabilota bacterium]|nr:cation diffusion facilitator family transporter [Methylomirabilota bacterium]
MHAVHSHSSRHKSRLWTVFGLTTAFLAVEVVVALATGSLSLLADAAHMLVDAGGLLMSLLAVWFAERPATPAKTYGYYRVEILVALINGVVLCLLAVGILVKAYERLGQPPHVPGAPMLVVAVVGLAVNLAGMALLQSGAGESLNVRGAYLEVLGDAVSSAAVIVAAVVILLTGWTIADPLASGAIALLILPRTWSLLRQAVNVLLEGAPPHLNVTEIETALRAAAGVRRVHDLHVWTLTSGREAMSAHVVVAPDTAPDRILNELHVLLHARFGIDHTTIQLETEPALLQITPPRSSRASCEGQGEGA